MKYIKMLGLLAVAAAALMAFAGSASATLTSPAGTTYAGTIHASSEGATSLTGSITITCQKSTVSGTLLAENNGATTASGAVSSLTFEECGNHTVTVKNAGELTVHTTKTNEGTVTSTGAEVTVLLHSGILGTVHCIYKTNETDIGELTGGTPGTLDIGSVSIPRVTTDGLCGSHSTWEGNYKVETPGNVHVD